MHSSHVHKGQNSAHVVLMKVWMLTDAADVKGTKCALRRVDAYWPCWVNATKGS